LGLIPPQEHDRIRQALDKAADIAGDYLDLGSLTGIAESAPVWEDYAFPDLQPGDKTGREQVTIGVIRDGAFQFYYPENIEALADRGAKVLEISAMTEKKTAPCRRSLYRGRLPGDAGRASCRQWGFSPVPPGCGRTWPADLCRMRGGHVFGGIPDCRR